MNGIPAHLRGPGLGLIFVYGIFALAATARATVQLIGKFEEAPLAYLLSALAGVVYILATVALLGGLREKRYRQRHRWHLFAAGALIFEVVGVLGVGLWSVFDAGTFPHDTVWSWFGRGYLFIPLVLPFLGLWWLKKVWRYR